MHDPVSEPPPRRSNRAMFVDATEMYLRTIFEIDEEEDGLAPRQAALGRRLGLSRSAVNQQVLRLAEDGLVELAGNRVALTERGRAAAAVVMRKHRLAERILVDVIGLEWELSHAEATRWQHVLGEAVERKLVGLLDDPTVSPFGNPIPGLAELGVGRRAPRPDGSVVTLARAARAGVGYAVVRQIPESVQADQRLLAELRAHGIVPGRTVRISPDGARSVRVATSAGCSVLDADAARSILVGVARPSATVGDGPAPVGAHAVRPD
jgi:DtxR family Mn-dependent transcriptional regulator